MTDEAPFQSELSKFALTLAIQAPRGQSFFQILALVFVAFVAQNGENSESGSSQREVSRSRLVVVTALSAIIADKIFGAFRRRRKRIRRAEKEELERYRNE